MNIEIKEAKVGVAALVPETGSVLPPITTCAIKFIVRHMTKYSNKIKLIKVFLGLNGCVLGS